MGWTKLFTGLTDARKPEIGAHADSASFDFSKRPVKSRGQTAAVCTELLVIPTQSLEIPQGQNTPASQATATEYKSSCLLHLFSMIIKSF